MPIFSNVTTNFSIAGTDIGARFVQKDYLIDVYPSLIGTFKQSGLWTYGVNETGALGNNNTTNIISPVQTVSGGTNWLQISAGHRTSAAIKTDGTLWTWGNNYRGILGDNDSTINKSSPVQTIASGTNWNQVSAGKVNGTQTVAIKTDGTLWTWGSNAYGALGDNTRINRSSPIQTVAGGTNWTKVSSGGNHVCAIKQDGTLWAWGRGVQGQLGDNLGTDTSSPVQTVAGGTNWKEISSGTFHSGAIKTDGTLWIWGFNFNGQLGNNNRTFQVSPIQTVSGGTNWKMISCGYYHTAAIKTDGTLWTWGNNGYGRLGDNSTSNRSSPVQTVSGGTNWKAVSAGNVNISATKTDGTLWLWGLQLDNNFGFGQVRTSSPTQISSGGTNWKSVSVGGLHIITIRDDSADIFGDPL